jgi:TfoX/Sxy family transcriptional regulator of competence genes
MAYDEQMAQKFRKELAKFDAITVNEKQMFGALGFMIGGKLAVCVGDKDVMYKLGVEESKKLIAQGVASPVVMGSRTMKQWVNIYFSTLNDPNKFKEYLVKAICYD